MQFNLEKESKDSGFFCAEHIQKVCREYKRAPRLTFSPSTSSSNNNNIVACVLFFCFVIYCFERTFNGREWQTLTFYRLLFPCAFFAFKWNECKTKKEREKELDWAGGKRHFSSLNCSMELFCSIWFCCSKQTRSIQTGIELDSASDSDLDPNRNSNPRDLNWRVWVKKWRWWLWCLTSPV